MYPVASKTPTSSPNRKRKKTPSPESSASRKNIIISPQGIISDRSSIQIGRSPIFAHSNRLFPTREAAICESYKAPEPLPQLTDIFLLDERSSLELTHAHPDSPETSESQVKITQSRYVILPFNLRQNPEEFHNDANGKLLDLPEH